MCFADGSGTSHGRDNQLIVWQLGITDETTLEKTMPIEDAQSTRVQPWILHILTVNALNFCSFSICRVVPKSRQKAQSVLIAVPNTVDSEGVLSFH